MELLKTWLPADLTDDEIEAGIREIVASTGAQSKKDMGKVMKEASAKYKGRVDGRKTAGDRGEVAAVNCHPEPPEARSRRRSAGGRSKDPQLRCAAARASTRGSFDRPPRSASRSSLRRLRMTGHAD